MYLTSVPHLLQTLFPSAVWCSAQEPRFRLTFDDGPHPQSTPKLLSTLRAKKLKATFFCLGEQLEKHPDLHHAMIDEGHLIANHGYSHLSGWTTDYEAYISNVERGAQLSGSNYYRPPYGRMTPRQYNHIKLQHQIVMWTSMPGDFKVKRTKEMIAQEVLRAYKGDEIIVLHDSPTCIDKALYAIDCLEVN